MINIIGAGIGGLTTAIALQQKNIPSRIYEQSDKLKPVGAGILLANNAMQVYDRLGLREELEAKGNYIATLKVVDVQLKPMSVIDLKYFEQKYGVKNIAIHRGALQEILASKVRDHLHLGHKLEKMEQQDGQYQLCFKEQSNLLVDNVIGADGINSLIRNAIFQSKIRDSHQMCWRGLADYTLPSQYTHEFNESWGANARFGFAQIAPKLVYWFAVVGHQDQPSDAQDWQSYYEDFHPMVLELLAATDAAKIHKAKLEDLKPMPSWTQDKVCLIGDAAHATTPNLGQGAGQAIEDAYCLAECVVIEDDLAKAFQRFQNRRQSKVNKIVNTSWSIGKIAHLKNPLTRGLRNAVLKITPAFVSKNQSASVFELV